ncbi:hypothetical protein [Nonomuraea rhizosphaerae]|uniref:hypothetical protein n=1 Tax=Nonomuraea rhizosphaerae TaxID=2665663 RepID=UPI001C5F67AC|nr:hypothetical protein [Nonomuraea rhizosphaerae]
MADVGDQDQVPSSDSPTTPFRKVVLPAEEESETRTVTVPRLPTPKPQPQPRPQRPRPEPEQRPQPQPQPQPEQRQQPEVRPEPRPQPRPAPRPQPANPQLAANPQPAANPRPAPPPPQAEPQPQAEAHPHVPPVAPPKRGLVARVGDVPIKVVYLLGAIVATVLAVMLVFVIFSGDVPKTDVPVQRQGAEVATVPGPSGSPKPSSTAVALPAAPRSLAYPVQSGTPTVVIGTISDLATGISYPRLGRPWTAKSFAPFAIAQRVGKVAVPHTVIASSMLPGDAPKTKPKTSADYRALAVRGARWTLRSQYPAGATLRWTGSQKVPVGQGWMLGYEVTYTVKGKAQKSRAVISVHEVGKTKPAMLYASIPQSGKSYYRDLNTLVTNVRTL